MTTQSFYSMGMVLSVLLFAASSCGDEVSPMMETPATEASQVYTLSMDIAKPQFEDEGTTRLSGTSWERGDKIYFCFSGTTSGEAVYGDGEWTFTIKSGNNLSAGMSGSCRAYYFMGQIDDNTNWPQVDLTSEQTALFQNVEGGTYSVGSGNRIAIDVHLQPAVWRLRFKGLSGTQVNLESDGIDYYSALNISTGIATKDSHSVNLTVGSDGATPFVYGVFNTSGDIALQLVTQEDKAAYNRTLSSSKLSNGKSGYFKLPTSTALYGWTKLQKEQTGPDFNGHDYVDLGLKDDQGRTIYWATCNIGAEKSDEYGLCFAWGETKGYTSDTNDGRSFDWANYKWMKFGCSSWEHITKYTFADEQTSTDWYFNGKFIGDYKTVLEPEDDAAHVNWGGDWRMPTQEEQYQLLTKCTWIWDSTKKGYTVKGPNDNSLFLPATGFGYYSSLSDAGSVGYYWSSSLFTGHSGYAHNLFFGSSYVFWGQFDRYWGQFVRAVCTSSE